jgi:hypothetical protein
MRKPLVVAITAVMSVGVAAFVPVTANAGAGDTLSTFTVSAGSGLSIAVPDGSVTPVNLGTATAGAGSLSHGLGSVTVTDGRGALTATWTATAASTDFTTGSASADETVAKANVGYYAGVGTPLLGQVGAFVPAGTALTPVALAGSGATVGTWAGTGSNTVTWSPTITFTLSPSQVVGTYTGTITHSVS